MDNYINGNTKVRYVKAYIHHIDWNDLNNPIDGSNWQVLCASCHIVIHAHNKMHRNSRQGGAFNMPQRCKIIFSRGCRCEMCGKELSLPTNIPKYLLIAFKEVNMTRGPARKAFSKRDMKWVGVTVDEYTNELMERAILLGKAESRVQAINKGLCLLLEIPYKTDEQVLAERQAEYMRLAIEAANPKTQQELDDEVLKKAEEIRLKREQQSQPQVMTPELMEELNKAAALADTKRAEIMSERERRRIQAEQKQVEESNGTNR